MNPNVRLTRRVTFSAGHRFWNPALSPEQNRELFGPWASPFNHGHNYILDVTTEGSVDVATGMVVNIKRIDDLLKRDVLAKFSQKSLNDEVAHFDTHPPTVENFLLHLRERLGGLPNEAKLVALRLEEMPTLWGELTLEKEIWTMTLTRTYEFAASHRLHAPQLPPEQNLELYGKCNNPAGHGHNYLLEVTITGEPDAETGMLVSIDSLDKTVQEWILNRYDHRNLDVDVPELAGKITTSEVVAQEIYKTLEARVPGKLYRVRLHETARNIFEVTAE